MTATLADGMIAGQSSVGVYDTVQLVAILIRDRFLPNAAITSEL